MKVDTSHQYWIETDTIITNYQQKLINVLFYLKVDKCEQHSTRVHNKDMLYEYVYDMTYNVYLDKF